MPPIRSSGNFNRNRGGRRARLVVVSLASLVLVGALFFLSSQGGAPPPQGDLSAESVNDVGVVELVDCLVAIDKIEPGTSLDPTRFRKETRPVLSKGASVVTSFDQLSGTFAASFIAAGQPLLTEYMTTRAPVNEIQANIPEGYRAVSIAVNDVSNVEGWVRAGAKVDVMLASQVAGKPAITLLVQNAKVLSAGKVLHGGDSVPGTSPATVTIMVTVDDASKIHLASSSGIMSLALRGEEDTVQSADAQTVTLDAVFGVSTPSAPAGPPREGRLTVGGRNYMIVKGKLIPEE